MLRRVVRAAGPRLAAREVKEGSDGFGLRLDRRAGLIGGLGVVAGLVQSVERRPGFEAEDLVRLARLAADNDDRRSVLVRERRPLHAGLGEDQRSRRRVHSLAVELEGSSALEHEVQLFLVVLLGMLVDDPVAGLAAGEAVDAEGRDPEMVPHRPVRNAAVVALLARVEAADAVGGHRYRLTTRVPDPGVGRC